MFSIHKNHDSVGIMGAHVNTQIEMCVQPITQLSLHES
jgi:hypothetical protein